MAHLERTWATFSRASDSRSADHDGEAYRPERAHRRHELPAQGRSPVRGGRPDHQADRAARGPAHPARARSSWRRRCRTRSRRATESQPSRAPPPERGAPDRLSNEGRVTLRTDPPASTHMSRATIDYGIDLGVEMSSIAVLNGTVLEIIPNEEGCSQTPSAVWIDKCGRAWIGKKAKSRYFQDPGNADIEFKRPDGQGRGAQALRRSRTRSVARGTVSRGAEEAAGRRPREQGRESGGRRHPRCRRPSSSIRCRRRSALPS